MRHPLLASLLALALLPPGVRAGETDDGKVTDESLNFEISLPDSIDWRKGALPTEKSQEHVKVHFWTEWADSDPPARCDVHLMVLKLNKETATLSLDKIALKWSGALEGVLTQGRDLKEAKGTLGGSECWSRDIMGEYEAGAARVTWDVARMGNYLYVLYALRTYRAVDDEQLEEELQEIRKSFKFLKDVKVTAHKEAKKDEEPRSPGGGAGEDPTKLARKTIELDHWKIKMVKPEGLIEVAPESFSQGEKDSNVVARFNGRGEQTAITIWVHAQAESAQRYTIEQLAERMLKSWQDDPSYKQRLDPEIDKSIKFPMAKDAIRMKLVGRRATGDTTIWVFAQCKNDRQYQLRVYYSGAAGDQVWKKQIDDFFKNFKPTK